MTRLPDGWAVLFDEGVSLRVGGCSADGSPQVCRGLGARVLDDGRLELVLTRRTGTALLQAVAETRRIALSASRPDTNRTLHVKGFDASASAATDAHQRLVEQCRDRFVERLRPLGFTMEQVIRMWYCDGIDELRCVRFTTAAAWDQSPGPGAGLAVELVP